jgi:hypothetical protein
VSQPAGPRTCRANIHRIHLPHAADDPTAPLRKPDCVQSETLAAVARGSGASPLAISGRDRPSRTHPHESSASASPWQKAGRRRFASRYSLLPTPLMKSTKRSPSTLRQGHERFGSASKTEPSSSTSPARQRSANHQSFARSFRHSPALKRSTWTRISAPSFDSYLIPKLIVDAVFRNKFPTH